MTRKRLFEVVEGFTEVVVRARHKSPKYEKLSSCITLFHVSPQTPSSSRVGFNESSYCVVTRLQWQIVH